MQYYLDLIKKNLLANNLMSPEAVLIKLLENYIRWGSTIVLFRKYHQIEFATKLCMLIKSELSKPKNNYKTAQLIFTHISLEWTAANVKPTGEFAKLINAFLTCYPHFIRMLDKNVIDTLSPKPYSHERASIVSITQNLLNQSNTDEKLLRKRYNILTTDDKHKLIDESVAKINNKSWEIQLEACTALKNTCIMLDTPEMKNKINEALIKVIDNQKNFPLLSVMPDNIINLVMNNLLEKISSEKIQALAKSYNDILKKSHSVFVNHSLEDVIKILYQFATKMSALVRKQFITSLLTCLHADNSILNLQELAIETLGDLQEQGFISTEYIDAVATTIVTQNDDLYNIIIKAVIKFPRHTRISCIKKFFDQIEKTLFLSEKIDALNLLVPYIPFDFKTDLIERLSSLLITSKDAYVLSRACLILRYICEDYPNNDLMQTVVVNIINLSHMGIPISFPISTVLEENRYAFFSMIIENTSNLLKKPILDIILQMPLAITNHYILMCNIIGNCNYKIPDNLANSIINRLKIALKSDSKIAIAGCKALGTIAVDMTHNSKAKAIAALKSGFSHDNLMVKKSICEALLPLITTSTYVLNNIISFCNRFEFIDNDDESSKAVNKYISKYIGKDINGNFSNSSFFNEMLSDLNKNENSWCKRQSCLALANFALASIIPEPEQLFPLVKGLIREIDSTEFKSLRKQSLRALGAMTLMCSADQKINYFVPIIVALNGKYKDDPYLKDQLSVIISDLLYDYVIHDEVLQALSYDMDATNLVISYVGPVMNMK
jgi:hypothetical protein